MNVVPKAAAPAPNPATPTGQSGRERAIQMLTQQAPQPTAVEDTVQTEVLTPQAVEETPTLAPVESKDETATDPLSSQYAILARKERQLQQKRQQQEQAYKAREEALKAKEAEIAAKEQEYRTGYVSKQSLQKSALDTILEAGLSPDQLFEQLAQLQQTQLDPRVSAEMKALRDQIAKLEAASETTQKQMTEKQQADYNQAVNQIRNDAKKLAFTDPNFELVKSTNSVNDVVELIEKTFQEDGTLLTVEEAMQQVEDYLVEEAEKLAKLSKIQKRLSSVAPAKAQAVATPTKQPQPMKTLTNAAGSSRQLSARERALLAFKGELK